MIMATLERSRVVAIGSGLAIVLALFALTVSELWNSDEDDSSVTVSGFDSDSSGWMSETELRSAVESAREQLTFPRGKELSGADMVDRLLNDSTSVQRASSNFEVGYEWVLVGYYHRCLWEDEFIEAYESGDLVRAHEALDVLGSALPLYRMDERGAAHFERVLDEAEHGRLTLITNDMEINCI